MHTEENNHIPQQMHPTRGKTGEQAGLLVMGEAQHTLWRTRAPSGTCTKSTENYLSPPHLFYYAQTYYRSFMCTHAHVNMGILAKMYRYTYDMIEQLQVNKSLTAVFAWFGRFAKHHHVRKYLCVWCLIDVYALTRPYPRAHPYMFTSQVDSINGRDDRLRTRPKAISDDRWQWRVLTIRSFPSPCTVGVYYSPEKGRSKRVQEKR